MRGARADDMHHRFPSGLIPAHAGSTPPTIWGSLCPRAHPRACGEHGAESASGVDSLGSSPRMRGARKRVCVLSLRARLIPAHAGSTQPGQCLGRRSEAHPRACGEHSMSLLSPDHFRGSSPRMRGALSESRNIGDAGGLIPAHAGSTSKRLPFSSPCRAHPRACGEHSLEALGLMVMRGSSPRMRGALGLEGAEGAAEGLIPAHAGSTLGHAVGPDSAGAHPRACGEHAHQTIYETTIEGSSPRMRGAQPTSRSPFHARRLIPAHAGSTSPIGKPPVFQGAHPRACGEHTDRAKTLLAEEGSSPRMRGAHFLTRLFT